MKKGLAFLLAAILLFSATTVCVADSPITSTGFYEAYTDVAIVNTAANAEKLDAEIAAYLADPEKPIDVKAAVINALGWNFNGKNNAEAYATLVYQKSVSELDLDSLPGSDLFCLGYLTAMDDYFHPENALPFLKKAEEKIKDSFTVAIIRAIVEGQTKMDHPDWNNVWKPVEEVLKNSSLKRDMRIEAVNIIFEYMSLYSDQPVTNPYGFATDPPSVTLRVGKAVKISILGGEAPYKIASRCREASAVIIQKNKILLRGLKEGSSQITIQDRNGATYKLKVVVK